MKRYEKFQFAWVIIIVFLIIIGLITLAYIYKWGNNLIDTTGYILCLILFVGLFLGFYGITVIVISELHNWTMKIITEYYLAILIIIIGTILTECKKEKATLPILITAAVSNITWSTATSGGNVTDIGGATISASGVCWSTLINSTITNSKTTDGTGIGAYMSSITGLTPVTTFYLRAYATKSVGTAYGSEISFATSSTSTSVTDINGNVYNTIIIGNQVWMQQNLKTTKYSNGDLIGTTVYASFDLDKSNEIKPKYQWVYNGMESNVALYGRLYTWYTIIDSRNVCPIDWHVPTDVEWTTLTDYLTNNGYSYNGSGDKIAKSLAATFGWSKAGTAGNIGYDQTSNNSSGFAALPSGARYPYGSFGGIVSEGIWWSATKNDTTDAWNRSLYNSQSIIERGAWNKRIGYSVRCLRDL